MSEYVNGSLNNKTFNTKYFLKEFRYLKDNNLLKY